MEPGDESMLLADCSLTSASSLYPAVPLVFNDSQDALDLQRYGFQYAEGAQYRTATTAPYMYSVEPIPLNPFANFVIPQTLHFPTASPPAVNTSFPPTDDFLSVFPSVPVPTDAAVAPQTHNPSPSPRPIQSEQGTPHPTLPSGSPTNDPNPISNPSPVNVEVPIPPLSPIFNPAPRTKVKRKRETGSPSEKKRRMMRAPIRRPELVGLLLHYG